MGISTPKATIQCIGMPTGSIRVGLVHAGRVTCCGRRIPSPNSSNQSAIGERIRLSQAAFSPITFPTGAYATLILLAASLLVAAGGCQSVKPVPTLPARNSFQLPKQHRLLEELTALRSEVSRRLELPVSEEPIQVYLFETPEEFRAFFQRYFPTFPSRRAFFIETDTRLMVYAYWGDRVAEDLRHEVSHGYMHSVVPNMPLWLDEGLAEYFEVTPGTGGLNVPHLEQLARQLEAGAWSPDLARLARLETVASMRQLEYAESWAWAHWLLHTTPERRELLTTYLRRLRNRETPQPLHDEIVRHCPEPDRALAEHVRRLAARYAPRAFDNAQSAGQAGARFR
jgi:hypothetical protein